MNFCWPFLKLVVQNPILIEQFSTDRLHISLFKKYLLGYPNKLMEQNYNMSFSYLKICFEKILKVQKMNFVFVQIRFEKHLNKNKERIWYTSQKPNGI